MISNKKNLKWKLYSSYIIIIVCQIIFLGGVSFYYINQTLHKQQYEQFKGVADTIFKSYEHTIYGAEQLIESQIGSDFVKRMSITENSLSNYELMTYKNDFDNQVNASSVSGAFVISPKQDLVISSFSVIEPIDIFLEHDFSFSEINKEDWTDIIANGTSLYFSYGKAVYNNSEQLVFLLIWPDVSHYSKKNSSKVVAIVNQSEIESIYKSVFPEDAVLSLELDGQKILLNKYGIIDDREKEIILTDLNNNNKEYIIQEKRTYNNLNCRLFVKKDDLYKDITKIQQLMIIFLILCLIVATIVIYIVSEVNFKPVYRIFDIMSDDKKIKNKRNTFSIIEEEVIELTEREKRLTESLSDSKEVLKEYAIIKLLLSENVKESELMVGLRIAHIEFMNKLFCVVNIRLNSEYKDIKRLNIIFNSNNNNIGVYVNNLQFENYILLLNINKISEVDEYIKSIKNYFDNEAISYIGGIGTTVDKIDKIHDSYKNSIKALDFKQIGEVNSFIFYNSKESSEKGYEITEDEQSCLAAMLKRGDYKKVEENFDRLVEENKEKGISMLEFKNLCAKCLFIAFDACKDRQESISKKYIINQIYDCNDVNQITNNAKQCFKHIVDKNSQQIPHNSLPSIYYQITSYIDKHYLEYDLSLTVIADALNVHKVYVSNVFNKNAGCSFTEYVNRKRITQAAIYLLENKYKISEIVDKSGFSSEATFRREFKRYIGISPSDYRSMSHKEDNGD